MLRSLQPQSGPLRAVTRIHDDQRGDPVPEDDDRLWHVTVTVGGPERTAQEVEEALLALASLRPFFHALRHDTDRAEVRFWEEAPSVLDAAALAMRVWSDFRAEIGLGDWDMTGFEVAHRPTYLRREDAWDHEVPVGFSPFG